MTNHKFDALKDAINARNQAVVAYLNRSDYTGLFRPAHIGSAVYSYIERGGKRLRPALLMICCGAVGGDEQVAIPAAAAVEAYHTMTLVHDDIIDRDELRRGAPTVHCEFTDRGAHELGYDPAESAHYGLTVGLLTGDAQHALAMLLMTELARQNRVNSDLVLALLADLNRYVSPNLVEGETIDFQQARQPIDTLTEPPVIDMIWKKTAVLYEFTGRAGAAIGLDDTTLTHPLVTAIAAFCGQCGIAFQLQDDILGIVGNEAQLGKPIGSDIREGKRTVIVLHAFREANPSQRATLLNILGNPQASEADIAHVTTLLCDLGGVAYAGRLARQYAEGAITHLESLPPSDYKELLLQLADFVVEREL